MQFGNWLSIYRPYVEKSNIDNDNNNIDNALGLANL